jgi:5-methylcytosine-specific restriction endonuclease McrA
MTPIVIWQHHQDPPRPVLRPLTEAERHRFEQQRYAKELEGEAWQKTRAKHRDLYKPGCCYCHRTDVQIDTHHLTYERRGHERMSDLVRLCHEDHFKLHRGEISKTEVIKRRNKWKKRRKLFGLL